MTQERATKSRKAQHEREVSRVHPHVRHAIESLATMRTPTGSWLWEGASIHRAVEEVADKLGAAAPPLRTVQERVRRARVRAGEATSDDRPWRSVEATKAEDVPIILGVIAEIVRASRGRWRSISRRDAAAIVRIRKAAPDLPPWETYLLALAYSRGEDFDPEALDAFLACRPWESFELWAAYQRAVDRPLGYISPGPKPEGSLTPAPERLIEWAALEAINAERVHRDSADATVAESRRPARQRVVSRTVNIGTGEVRTDEGRRQKGGRR